MFKVLICGAALAAALSVDVLAADLPVKVTIKTKFAEPVYVTHQSIADIRRLANKPGVAVTGLTTTHFNTSFEAAFYMEGSGGSWCVTSIDADFKAAYDEVKVYIPREFDRGSCYFRVVAEHEEKHVAASRRVLKGLSSAIVGLVSETVRQKGPKFCGSTETAAKEKAQAAVKAGLARVLEREKKLHAQHQEPIDTRDEYRRTTAACKGWPLER